MMIISVLLLSFFEDTYTKSTDVIILYITLYVTWD